MWQFTPHLLPTLCAFFFLFLLRKATIGYRRAEAVTNESFLDEQIRTFGFYWIKHLVINSSRGIEVSCYEPILSFALAQNTFRSLTQCQT